MLAVFGQIAARCVINNRAPHSWQNPGMVCVVLWRLPLTVIYICYISLYHLATVWTWIAAIIYLAAYLFLFINKLTYSWLTDNTGKYPFSQEEMRRYYSRYHSTVFHSNSVKSASAHKAV